MRVLVLGSAAGGGVPQWNCRCPVCDLAWRGDPRVRARTQTSVAVSGDGQHWVVLDAAPELRHQILANPALQPASGGRNSPIAAVVLSSGDVDHLAGLLCLREGHRFTIYASDQTLIQLTSSPVFDVLNTDLVQRTPISPDAPFAAAGLTITPFAVPGKVPLYRESGVVEIGAETEAVIGLDITDGRRRFCYVPGLAHLTPRLVERLGGADALALDGTTFTDDEMPRLGLSPKSASRMGHLAISGQGGSLHAFVGMAAQRIYIHLNNSNPVLVDGSAERRIVEAAGWAVAHDGMELAL